MPDVGDEIERARVEILRARSGVTVWNIDSTPDYTPSTRAGADRAIRSLELAARRIDAALDRLRAEVAEADAGRTTADNPGHGRTVPPRSG